MSLPTGILDYASTSSILTGLATLGTQMGVASGVSQGVTSALTPPGTEGASIVSLFQQEATQQGWYAAYMAGLGYMQVDHAAALAHVGEVAAVDAVGQALFIAQDATGIAGSLV